AAFGPVEVRAVAALFVALWVLSPAVARWISRPVATRPPDELDADARQRIAATTRRSWRFFEPFVTAEDNWLPPDNFQDDPRPVVAPRTAPTNIGVYLLSTVAARDLGFIGTLDATDRLGATLSTLADLERYRGHVYNWYDTRTLKPLEPRHRASPHRGNPAGPPAA